MSGGWRQGQAHASLAFDAAPPVTVSAPRSGGAWLFWLGLIVGLLLGIASAA